MTTRPLLPSESLSDSLECSVCLSTYNLTNRLPKALSCHHTICSWCVYQIKKGSTIICPTCRTQCSVGQVAVNFGLKDVLENLCEECTGQNRVDVCVHCNQKLCTECQKAHAETFHKDLRKELDKLDRVLNNAIDISKDGSSLLAKEGEKEVQAHEAIANTIQEQRNVLDQLEKELKGQVKQSKSQNLETYSEWSKMLDKEISAAKDFSVHSKHDVGMKYTDQMSINEMLQMKSNCQELVKRLIAGKDSRPNLRDYSADFEGSVIGELIRQHAFQPIPGSRLSGSRKESTAVTSSAGTQTEQEMQPMYNREVVKRINIPNYTSIKHKHLVGSSGTDWNQFDRPFNVVCTLDSIIVSDEGNHRIKWYDENLHLKHMVGSRGSGAGQFKNPTGLAIGPDDEVYLSDLNNHRVVVLSKHGNYVRDFGTTGSKQGKFQSPQGIAVCGELVYVCDMDSYRIKVLKRDGTFVRHIGSKGRGPGCFNNFPIHVELTSPRDGRIFVTVLNNRQLVVFNKRGDYLGNFPENVPRQLSESIPTNVAVDQFDNILICYKGTDQLAIYNMNGVLINLLGSRGRQPGQFRHPSGVAVNTENGYIVVCDLENNRLQTFDINQ